MMGDEGTDLFFLRKNKSVPSYPPSLQFAPETLAGQLRFALRGRPLLLATARSLARAADEPSRGARRAGERAAAGRLLRHLDVRLAASGLEHVQAGGPFIVVALHEGVLDVPCLATLPLPLRFVARREIFHWPRIGPALAALGHVAIDPEQGAGAFRSLLRTARDCAACGESLVVFPQGTLLGIETDFRGGAFRVARALGLPLLPVAIRGTHRIWEHPFSARLRYGVSVAMRVFPPIAVPLASPEDLRGRVMGMLKAEALRPEGPAPRRFVPERDGWWDGFSFEIDPEFGDLRRRFAERRAQRARGQIYFSPEK